MTTYPCELRAVRVPFDLGRPAHVWVEAFSRPKRSAGARPASRPGWTAETR